MLSMETNDLKMPWEDTQNATAVNPTPDAGNNIPYETKPASTDVIKYGDGKPHREFIKKKIKIDANK